MDKICKNCNFPKSIEEFCKRKDTIDGYHRYCKKCAYEMGKKYYHETGKHTRKDYYKQQRIKNKEYHKNYCKNHYHTNKELYREWNRNQYENNLEFKIKHIVTARLHEAIKTYNNLKKQRTIEYLGCTIEEYMKYLELQFTPEMTWENQGEYWEIDHIQPIDSFDLTIPEELFKCFHYTNTQPLFKTENREKSNKIF